MKKVFVVLCLTFAACLVLLGTACEEVSFFVTGVTLDKATLEMSIPSAPVQLKATVQPANAGNKAVEWSSSDDEVVTVENGLVTAIGVGTATVTVKTAEGGYTAECSVLVNDAIIESISVVEPVSFEIIPGEESLKLIGGKIKINYNGNQTEEKDVEETWISSYDLFTKKATIDYMGKTATSDLSIETTTVSNSADLIQAMMSNGIKLILVKNGEYNIASSPQNTYQIKDKFIVGEQEVILNLTGFVSSQSALLFSGNTTLKNIKINAEDGATDAETFHAVKFSKIVEPTELIEKIYLENVEINGAKGLNIHAVSKAVLKNVSVVPTNTLKCVAVSISESNVELAECDISFGTWGSIGLMYKEGYRSSSLKVDSLTEISFAIYVEEFDVQSEDNNVPISGLGSDWLSGDENGRKIYYTQEMLPE